jgi:threonylcarbamoyladenosine tRNA methylthiotransferase MtaB
MGRNYTRRQVLKIIQQLRQIQPRINFTVDIIVGFPGETEKDFQQTYDFCQQVGFYKIHVFRYSVRQGTRSADFKNQISLETKKARSLELRQLDLILRQRVVNNFLNTNSEVLFENKIGDTWQGWTDNYIKAYFKTDKDLHNQTIKVKLIKNFKNGVLVEENGLT